jgi:tRNA (guanine-N7-)-methyltransferase
MPGGAGAAPLDRDTDKRLSATMAPTPGDTRASAGAAPRRAVRSFVLREGRLTAAQERAFRELWPRFGVDWRPGEALDPRLLFTDAAGGARARAIALEIGFGDGEALAEMAAAQPERGFVGLEVHRPGVGHLLLALERLGLDNVRVLRADAGELLGSALPAASLDAVHLFFPDPWPKKRHHKRRIVQPAFVAKAARVLRPGGTLHLATDWTPYAEHMLAVLDGAADLFENTAGHGRYAERPAHRPVTKFERRGLRLGHRVHDLILRRR